MVIRPPAVFSSLRHQVGDVAAVGLVHQPQQALGHTRLKAAHQVDAVVVRHLLDEPGHAFAAGALDHLHLPIFGEVREDGGLVADIGVRQETPDLLDVEVAGQRLGDRGGVQRFEKYPHAGVVVVFEQFANLGTEQHVRHGRTSLGSTSRLSINRVVPMKTANAISTLPPSTSIGCSVSKSTMAT